MIRIDDFHGLPAVNLLTPGGDRATVLLHGAHVVSWIPAGGSERLYLSGRSAYGNGKAIRGGVPVIFPQFNQRGPDFSLPRHGFARTRSWTVDEGTVDEAGPGAAPGEPAFVRLRLADDPDTRALWPCPFSLTLTVSVGAQRLDLALRVGNPGPQPLAFTAALHTYLQVDDIRRASLGGLEGVRYFDAVGNSGSDGAASALSFDRETDRIYYDVPAALSLRAPNGRLDVAMAGFRDAVVWNPWAERCAALPDMPDDGYRQMLCVEAAAIGKPVTLQANGHWLGRQTLTVR